MRGPSGARKAGVSADERRRCAAVLEAVERSGSLNELLEVTLAALDEHLGYSKSAFMLALASPARHQARAYAGITHGQPIYALEEYFERWADRDPLASVPARRCFSRTGKTAIAEIYPVLDPPRKRFVDDFLRRTASRHQLSHRLALGQTDAYLTLMGSSEHTEQDERLVAELVPGLQELLRPYLPVGLEGLSLREAQTAELVALGFSNRQIADVLHVQEDTVKKHVSSALGRIGVNSRTALAVAWATGRRMAVNGS